MLFLPAIQGRFPVGVTTFVTPVKTPRSIGNVKLRRPSSRPNEPNSALYLEEVAFTAYYPTDTVSKAPKRGVDWFIRPVRESLYGFAAFLGMPAWILWPIVYLFGSFIKIPAYLNAPLLDPKKSGLTQDQWPLVIFSHGLGGSRTAYSQFCSRVAASGRVVLALEHRDGTGTVSMPRSWHVDGNKSEPRTILYLRETDVHWDESDTIKTSPYPLRVEQLAFRHHEVYTAYNTFRQFIHNAPDVHIETIDGSEFDRQSWGMDSTSGKPLVNSDQDVVLAGHSFGGCTVLSILSSEPSPEYVPIPVSRALVLDPWIDPLPTPGPIPVSVNGKSNDLVDKTVESVQSTLEENGIVLSTSVAHPRILVINSETFTLWKDHFARLQEIIKGWEPNGGRIVTLVDSKHTSFSDFPILPVVSGNKARNIFNTIADISVSFLGDRFEEELESHNPRKMEIKIIGVRKDGRPRRKIVGNPGDVIAEYTS